MNGWELSKAIKLMLKGNAVIVEWLQSPIAYIENEPFRQSMLQFSTEIFDRASVAHHYLHLLRRQYEREFSNTDQVKIKKLFYALRPAIALLFLRENPAEKNITYEFPSVMCRRILVARFA